jgi:hypothetical protein
MSNLRSYFMNHLCYSVIRLSERLGDHTPAHNPEISWRKQNHGNHSLGSFP